MKRIWRRVWGDDRGATAIEYALLIGIIGIGLLLSANFLGGESIELWLSLSSAVSTS